MSCSAKSPEISQCLYHALEDEYWIGGELGKKTMILLLNHRILSLFCSVSDQIAEKCRQKQPAWVKTHPCSNLSSRTFFHFFAFILFKHLDSVKPAWLAYPTITTGVIWGAVGILAFSPGLLPGWFPAWQTGSLHDCADWPITSPPAVWEVWGSSCSSGNATWYENHFYK